MPQDQTRNYPLYFDDLKVGDSFSSAPGSLSEEKIIAFAQDYDPQSFHLDREAAKQSIFGGLVASGFQTIGFAFRLIWDTGVFKGTNIGGHGLDEIRWPRPVKPGDRLTVTVTVEELIPSKSRPDRGTARTRYRMRNQSGEEVFSMLASQIIRRRGG